MRTYVGAHAHCCDEQVHRRRAILKRKLDRPRNQGTASNIPGLPQYSRSAPISVAKLDLPRNHGTSSNICRICPNFGSQNSGSAPISCPNFRICPNFLPQFPDLPQFLFSDPDLSQNIQNCPFILSRTVPKAIFL